jgi:hypothetical protein
MHHDSVGNSCPKEGYVMSPSRGTNGETQWSHCSAEVVAKLGWAKCLQDSARPQKNLDHSRFLDSPGQIYTAKRQCEILLRDKDAVMSPNQQLSTICYNLQCKTPHRSGYYFAGPALDGTKCGNKKVYFDVQTTVDVFILFYSIVTEVIASKSHPLNRSKSCQGVGVPGKKLLAPRVASRNRVVSRRRSDSVIIPLRLTRIKGAKDKVSNSVSAETKKYFFLYF